MLQKIMPPRLVVVALLSILILSSCISSQTDSVAPDDSPIELVWLDLCEPFTTPVAELLIAKFESEHENTTVTLECVQGDYAESIFAKAAAGNLPDVIFSADLFVVPFVNNGVLVDLETLAETDDSFTFDDIYPNILGLGQVVGTPGTYMIPSSWDSVQMYYNKDLFEDAGAPLPEDDWSWDEFLAACQTIQEANPDVDCISNGGTGGWDWWPYFIPWVVGYGGEPVNEDFTRSTFSSEASLAGIQAYVDLWTVHDVVRPLGVEYPGDNQGCFVNQDCATFFHISGFMRAFRERITDFEWDVAVTPAHPVAHVAGMGTFGYSISRDSKHPELAWDLIKGLASQEVQGTILRGYGGIPILKSMADDPIFEELEAPPANIKAFIRGGGIGIFPPMGYPSKCGSLYAGFINQTIKTALEESIRGVKTVEQAFIDADAEIQTCMDSAE